MNATNELFDSYKSALGVSADLGGAKALGVKAQTVSNWRNRGSQASPKLIEAMCRRTGQDASRWLLRVMAEQAPDPADRAVWKRVAKQVQVSMACASVAAASALYFLFNGVADASAAASALTANTAGVLGNAPAALMTMLPM